jgi:hypothetical protein
MRFVINPGHATVQLYYVKLITILWERVPLKDKSTW